MTDLILNPIGYLKCEQKYSYQVPRQSVYANNEGFIQLNKGCNFEQALKDLTGMERIWVIFQFHQNSTWKPLVTPPVVEEGRKISLFATRSPHRPNPLGLSCLELVRVEGLKVYVRNFDLINNTPILDIKPYIPASDSFPEAKTGWLKPKDPQKIFRLCYKKEICNKINWLEKNTDLGFKSFLELQLGYDPLNKKRKRLELISENKYILSYRTWRIKFIINPELKEIDIIDIFTGYLKEELELFAKDKYLDKNIHRLFKKRFLNSDD